MNPVQSYFLHPKSTSHKQYEALRLFFIDGLAAKDVALKYGYTVRGFYSLVRDFRQKLADAPQVDPFFIVRPRGRKAMKDKTSATHLIVDWRKKNLSVPDIKVLLDAKDFSISERTIHTVLQQEGFVRLPRRDKTERLQIAPQVAADESIMLHPMVQEKFGSNALGVLCFLPYLKMYGIDRLIGESDYPETRAIDKTSSILAFLALKLSNIKRYANDDLWCMDRGLGLFAGLNVLPKTGWYSSYSFRVTGAMNQKFLKGLHDILCEFGLLSDTVNLDFTTIPYWGNSEHLENNWSGKRRHALASLLCLLAQDPETGLIEYGSTAVQHKNQPESILEFLDFSRKDGKQSLRYLVFDSKLTNYQNLDRLNKQDISFVTIRRRGKRIVDALDALPETEWKRTQVPCAGHKKRWLRVNEQMVRIKGYDGMIRQIAITGHGKIKPALIITNDTTAKTAEIIRKYSRRWLIEKNIAEQIDFFHLNRVSSSMVIKVDFDLVMTILAYNLYRLFAQDLDRYSHLTASRIFEKFIHGGGDIEIKGDRIRVLLKKKRSLPIILETMEKCSDQKYPHLSDMKLIFEGATRS